MTTTGVSTTVGRRATLSDPAYQAFLVLRTVFTVAPILFGLDKFANLLVYWPSYLAPWIDHIVPGTAQQDMYAVGVIELWPESSLRWRRGWEPGWWPRG